MFVLSVLEAPNKTNSLCVQTHLAKKLFLILIININVMLLINVTRVSSNTGHFLILQIYLLKGVLLCFFTF